MTSVDKCPHINIHSSLYLDFGKPPLVYQECLHCQRYRTHGPDSIWTAWGYNHPPLGIWSHEPERECTHSDSPDGKHAWVTTQGFYRNYEDCKYCAKKREDYDAAQGSPQQPQYDND